MTAEIVNLRQARKLKARADKGLKAAENRARFGQSKAERERVAAEARLVRLRLDQHQREPDGETS